MAISFLPISGRVAYGASDLELHNDMLPSEMLAKFLVPGGTFCTTFRFKMTAESLSTSLRLSVMEMNKFVTFAQT